MADLMQRKLWSCLAVCEPHLEGSGRNWWCGFQMQTRLLPHDARRSILNRRFRFGSRLRLQTVMSQHLLASTKCAWPPDRSVREMQLPRGRAVAAPSHRRAPPNCSSCRLRPQLQRSSKQLRLPVMAGSVLIDDDAGDAHTPYASFAPAVFTFSRCQ